MASASEIRTALRAHASPERAKINAYFFKTEPGKYGHGDVFIGVTVPAIRGIVKECKDTPIETAAELVQSPIHEERLLGLLFLVARYKNKKSDEKERERIYNLYLKLAKKYINNWDLVDLSARDIVGEYILAHPSEYNTLVQLAQSKNLWEKRIAIIASWSFIRNNSLKETFTIAEILMHDDHDLIHKATGWMLRECWKRDNKAAEKFLTTHIKAMPRTCLRYAIEKMEPEWRREFMKR